MATFTGISTLSDLTTQVLKGSAIEYGLDKLNAEIVKSLNTYNKQVSELMNDYAESVSEQVKVFGMNDTIDGVESDEFGKSRTSKTAGKWEVAFPLKKYIFGVGYSFDWLQTASVQEVNKKFIDLQIGHQKNIVKQMRTALFTMNSNVTFVDSFFNGETLTLKGFWNADSSNIPANAAGTTFAGASHTHYAGAVSGSVAATDIDSLVSNVTEHDCTQNLLIGINAADAATVKALSGFTALSSSLLNYSGVTSTVQTLDLTDLNNRVIGLWKDSVPVWVKPFVPAHYMVCMSLDNPMGKPVGYRQHHVAALRGLRLNSKSALEPMITEEGISFEGMAVMNRSAGAVLQLNNSTFSAPTIA
jgi:hypothetical protein